jgi:uncharacterized protein
MQESPAGTPDPGPQDGTDPGVPGPCPAAPALCHVFTVADRSFVYDAHGNTILGIDGTLADVLRALGRNEGEGARDERLRRASLRWGGRAVARALQEVSLAQREEGLFLPERPRIVPRCAACQDDAAYTDSLSQLTLTVTERCNLRCRYCVYTAPGPWIRSHGGADMPLEVALASVRFFAEHSGATTSPVVSFYGGEPLLRLDLIRTVVGDLRGRPDGDRYKFIIDTNGLALTEEAVELVADASIHLQVSLDGPPAVHDRNRRTTGGAPTHGRLMAGLERLLRRDPGAARRLSFTATAAPPFDLPAVCEWFVAFPLFQGLGIEGEPLVRLRFADLEALAPERRPGRPGDRKAAADQLAELRRRYLEACGRGERRRLGRALRSLFEPALIRLHHRPRQPLPAAVAAAACCLPGQRRLHVRADGSWQPCERLGDNIRIGHARTGFDAAAVDELFRAMHAAVAGRCPDCWALRLCDLCFAALAPSWSRQDGPPEVPARACESVKRGWEDTLRLYVSLQACGEQAWSWLGETVST